MARLKLSLFGSFHVTLDNRPVNSFAYDKVRALLAYLVVEADRPHRREALAELLWPDQPAATTRHNLSQALTTLRQAIGNQTASPSYLLTTRESVQWNRASDHVVDVAGFTTLIDACRQHAHPRRDTCAQCALRLEQAADLYADDFLAHFTIGDSAAFEEWALLRRESLQQRMFNALAWLAEYHVERGAYPVAAQYIQRQIALDPWREDAHRRLMDVLARSGQRAAALRHYEQTRAVLADELAIEPDAVTTTLYEQIRAGELAAEGATQPGTHHAMSSGYASDDPPAHLHNVPAPTTPFVGRERESATLNALLANPECRLITLVGPGGIGKTRLSQHVAQTALGAFAHGIYFVPLATVRSTAGITTAIADALHLQFFGHDDPVAQLCAYVRSRHMLLVLDNVEHLLDGASIISDLLRAAPEIKLLATSRERLNLHSEWVYEVEGLNVPAQDVSDAIEHYSAVQLWVQSARRTHSHFELRADEQHHVARICRLVSGMPLAIELAAAWISVLSCAEIAGEIEKNLDFLAATTSDVPERHRSVRAVFDHSWNLLGERERTVFRRLSVFHGGLTRAAAERVAGASLTSIAALVAKSLLRRTTADRYEIHELLRQYGAAKLHEIAEESQQTRAHHAAFYSEFLARCAVRLKGRDQQAAIKEIIDELENIRAAWHWAIEHHDLATMNVSFEGLWLFFASHGNVSEEGSLFDQAIDCLEHMTDLSAFQHDVRDCLLAKLYSGLGPMHYRLGHIERAQALLKHSIVIFRRIHAPRDLAFALHHLAATLHLQGDYLQEHALLHESIALSEAAGDRWLTGYSRNDLGLCLHLLGDDSGGRQLCTESFVIFEAIDDRRGMAFALNNLGVIAAAQGNYGEAERLHRQSLALRSAIDDCWGMAMSLLKLGVVLGAAGQIAEARVVLLDALRKAYAIRALPVALEIVVELARLLIIESASARAQMLLSKVMHHPALTSETRHKLEALATNSHAGSVSYAVERSIGSNIDALLNALLVPDALEAPHAWFNLEPFQ